MLAVLDIVVMVSHYPLLVDHLVASKVIFGDVVSNFSYCASCFVWRSCIVSAQCACAIVCYLYISYMIIVRPAEVAF